MEVLRFGPGFRRSRPAAGTHGLAEATIWGDARARITELAFSDRALIAPRTSSDRGLFIVIAGGGWVQVGEERTPINHGEAVEWPPGVAHGAWTDGTTMRAILVELPDPVMEVPHVRLTAAPEINSPTPAKGRLADREARPEDHDASEGEPW